MPKAKDPELDEKRRKQILEAALRCFLSFGFSKTSMDDIAREAGVSRPLVYLKFKNKDDVFAGVFDLLMQGRFDRAGQAMKGRGSKRERLLAVAGILLVEPWDRIVGQPMTGDFYEICSVRLPQVTDEYRRNFIRRAQEILGDKELGEVFFLATEGLHVDLPPTKVLSKRLEILVDQFARG